MNGWSSDRRPEDFENAGFAEPGLLADDIRRTEG
jgi:hypothetical protein